MKLMEDYDAQNLGRGVLSRISWVVSDLQHNFANERPLMLQELRTLTDLLAILSRYCPPAPPPAPGPAPDAHEVLPVIAGAPR